MPAQVERNTFKTHLKAKVLAFGR